jgi:hypothetical protein
MSFIRTVNCILLIGMPLVYSGLKHYDKTEIRKSRPEGRRKSSKEVELAARYRE